MYERARIEGKLGTLPNEQELNAQSEMLKATLSLEKASQQLDDFDFTTQSSKDISDLIKAHIESELKSLDAQRQHMTIRALADGTVGRLHVAKGSFIELGDPLMEIA